MRRIVYQVLLGVMLAGLAATVEAAPVRGGGGMRSGGMSGGVRTESGFRGGGAFRGGGGFHGGGGGGNWHGHHGGHFSTSIVVGGPFWDPWWWGYPYPYPYSYPYYSAPPVVVEQRPQQYIYQESEPQGQQYWYYCQKPEGYYPYVKRCPGGWMKVVPPAAPQDEEE